jgi:flagellar basal body rod protein FlgC
MDAISTAFFGLADAANRLDRAAQRVALPQGDDFAGAIVDTVEAGEAFKANAAVIRAADQMTGALLDILA